MRTIVSIVVLLAFTACRFTAPGEEKAREALAEEGKPYSRPFESRELPEVEANIPFFKLLDRALRVDPELEAAYFQWSAAFAKAIQAGSPPDPTIGIGWMFPASGAWDSLMALAVLPLANRAKLESATKVAMEEARTAHVRFEALRFLRKGKFRQTYAAFDFAARDAEIARRERALVGELESVARASLASGKSSTGDLLRLQVELTKGDDAIAASQAQIRVARASVNALLSRPTAAPLDPPEAMEPLEFDATDEQLLALAGARNPAIVELAASLAAREAGLERARAEDSWDPALSYEKQSTNQLMIQFTIPLYRDRVRAAIEQAEAEIRGATAQLRAKRNDVAAETAEAIAKFREAERRRVLLADRWLPQAREAYRVLAAKFGGGTAPYTDVIEAKRSLLELERALEKSRTDREAAVGDLLACCGADVTPLDGGAVAVRR